jgi:oligoribonuclease (3'-5' exoribonuclease)
MNLYALYGKKNTKLTIKDIKENIRQIFFYIFTLLNNS